MRVLFVEDSARLREYVAEGLRQAGFVVDVAVDGEEGLWAAESNAYDTVVLDIVLPKLDGLTVLERIRERGCDMHVLMLTAKDTVPDRVEGLTRGADDYLVKPFAMEELIARIQSLTRRRYGVRTAEIQVGDLTIDTARRCISIAGESVDLQPREYRLLEFLALQRDTVVSRADIERHIYDDRAEPMSNVVDSAVCQLRRKIDAPGRRSYIQTRRGMGYVLTGPDS